VDKPPFDVDKALDEVIGKRWRADANAPVLRTWRDRLLKWTAAALLAVVVSISIVAILEANRPRPAAKPAPLTVQVQVLPSDEKNPAAPEGARDAKRSPPR